MYPKVSPPATIPIGANNAARVSYSPCGYDCGVLETLLKIGADGAEAHNMDNI